MLNNRIGTHIRMRSSVHELLQRADFLDLSFFQCFFVPQETGKLIQVPMHDINAFLKIRRAHFSTLFCHISYWVNLSSLGNNGFLQLRREMMLAKRLGFTHFVLHAGNAKGACDKMQGIDALAVAINQLLRLERHITLLLENGCHGNLVIGSDIDDFRIVLEKIDKPERLGFCIDTAHAYSFGYNIGDIQEQEKFIHLLDKNIGIERIKLIHLNDAAEKLGSRIDRHAVIGEGSIGSEALRYFALHSRLEHIPIVLELPELSMKDELVILNKVREW